MFIDSWRWGEISMWERNIDRVPLECAQTEDQTHNLLANGTMLQPTEPPARANDRVFFF